MADEIKAAGYTFTLQKNDIILMCKGTSKKFKNIKAAHGYAIKNKRV